MSSSASAQQAASTTESTVGTVAGEKRRRVEEANEGGDGDVPEQLVINDINRNFQTGDVRLVSSDGLVFKCNVHQLGFSDVLSSMLQDKRSTPEGIVMTFTDQGMEYGRVIAMFLDSTQGRMKSRLVDDDDKFEDMFSFAAFLQKWECAALIVSLKLVFQPAMLDNDDSSDAEDDYDDSNWNDSSVFAIGAILGDIDLCYAGIRHGARQVSYSDEDAFLDEECDESPSLDLRGTSLAYMAVIPPKYALALLRAQRDRDMSEGSEDWKTIANEFRRLMRGPQPDDK